MAYMPINPSNERQRYNVDWTVGLGAFNYKDDVMLVQSLLNVCYFRPIETEQAENRKSVHGFDGRPPTNMKELKIDGLCGKDTLAMIKAFQVDMKHVLYPDSKVDPHYPDDRATPHGHRWTIKALNVIASYLPSSFNSLQEWAPEPLKKSLKRRDLDALQHTHPWPQPMPKIIVEIGPITYG